MQISLSGEQEKDCWYRENLQIFVSGVQAKCVLLHYFK